MMHAQVRKTKKNFALLKAMAADGFSPSSLAEQAGICEKTVSNIINRRPCHAITAAKIALVLNRHVEDLELG